MLPIDRLPLEASTVLRFPLQRVMFVAVRLIVRVGQHSKCLHRYGDWLVKGKRWLLKVQSLILSPLFLTYLSSQDIREIC